MSETNRFTSGLVIPNSEYLTEYLSGAAFSDIGVLLPHERAAVDLAIAKQRNAYEEIIEEKVAVSGGDDWHDGAFTATDNQAKIVGDRMSAIRPFESAPTVNYPDKSELRVTLGSRVIVDQSGYKFPVDLVGFREGHPEDLQVEGYEDAVTPMSPQSPLARSIIGLTLGQERSYERGQRRLSARVILIDQVAIKNHFVVTTEGTKEED